MPWETVGNQIRHRVKEPNLFIEDSMRTKELPGVKGVSIIIGKLKDGDGTMVTQAWRFDAEEWTVEDAKKWIKEHGEHESKHSNAIYDQLMLERDARSKKYRINVSDNGSLLPLSGTSEDDYGDPVNYMFQMNNGQAGQCIDWFSRDEARKYYNEKSQITILTRLIERAMKDNIDVMVGDGDPLFDKLPNELKGRTHKSADSKHALMKLSGTSAHAARAALRDAGIRKSGLSFVERGGDVYVYAKKADLKTVDIQHVEAFRSGSWTDSGGVTTEYSDDDIANMATDYNKLERQGCFEAPVKLGHDDTQPFKTDGYPAFGWLCNAVAEGGRLFFDLCGVPSKVAELIKAKAYKKRSLEIYHSYEDEETGRVIKHLPSGLALLGAMLPALGSLEEIHALYGNKLASTYSMDASGNDDISNKEKKGSEHSMTEEEKKAMEDLKAENARLKAELEKLQGEMSKATSDHAEEITKLKGDHETAIKDSSVTKAEHAKVSSEIATLKAELNKSKEKEFVSAYGKKFTPADMTEFVLPKFRTLRDSGDEVAMSAFTKSISDRKDSTMLGEYAKENPDATRGVASVEEMMKKAAELCRADGKDFSTQANYSHYMKQAGWTIAAPEGEE